MALSKVETAEDSFPTIILGAEGGHIGSVGHMVLT